MIIYVTFKILSGKLREEIGFEKVQISSGKITIFLDYEQPAYEF
jgi:hypothetical protein